MKKVFLISLIIGTIIVSVSCKTQHDNKNEVLKLQEQLLEKETIITQQKKELGSTQEMLQTINSMTEMTYQLKEVQLLHGVSEIVGSEPIRVLPYTDALAISKINQGNINIIALVVNKQNEDWVLVESVDPFLTTDSPFGFVPIENLKQIEQDNSQEDWMKNLPNVKSVTVGSNINQVKAILGNDYAEIKARGGYWIHYFGENLSEEEKYYDAKGETAVNLETGIDVFINKATNLVTGFRILSEDYEIDMLDGIKVGANANDVIDKLARTYESKEIGGITLSEEIVLFDLQHGYVLGIVTDKEKSKVLEINVVKEEFYLR